MDQETRQQKERRVWRRLAASYDERTLATYRRAYELSIEKAVRVVTPDDDVLEIGCGTGIVTLGVAPHVRQLTCIDITPEMLAEAQAKVARRGLKNVVFRLGDGYHQPEADESFDVVLLFNLLHIVKEPESILREACRLLKPGGFVVSATDCFAEPVPLRARMLLGIQRMMKLAGVIPFVRYYHKLDLRKLFEDGGFEVREAEDLQAIPVNHYILARKNDRGELKTS